MPKLTHGLENEGSSGRQPLSSRSNLLSALRDENLLVCDGAMGTELQREGLPLGLCGDVWNLENPNAVARVHRRYVEAGADILLTNTFSANRYRLAHYGLADKVQVIAREAVKILRSVATEKTFLLGELGPLGEFLEPYGEVSHAAAVTAFREAIEVFAGEGVHGIIIETVAAPEEMECAIEAARAVTDLPLIACFTFESSPVGLRTMSGATPEQCAELLAQLPANIVGCNCGTNLSAKDYEQLVATFAHITKKPVIVEPNAGTPELIDGQIVYRATPEALATWVPQLVEAGARIIGGCCGTGPEHIRAFRQAVNSLRS